MLISPAKSIDMQVSVPDINPTQARFLDDSQQLINQLQTLNPEQIQKLMGISEKLSELNYQRFQDWVQSDSTVQCPALFAFQGDVYQGLAADSLAIDELEFAQKHLRILSGLYGLLRPLDLIQAYRLEMGTKFANQRGAHLYAFWDDKISTLIKADMPTEEAPELVNLASNEYFKAVKPKLIGSKVITPVFKDLKNGQYKIISFYAKKARGLMVAYALKHKITQAEQLKAFDSAGYHFAEALSDDKQWVFIRNTVF
ncbi:MAG: peroxide stress protein YaaA [Methyloprofundus sp.]|nr:peroxide stress protein YaaA [Methyloprofundus sp.]MDT8424707.1 peroxide stress protein YaaA [Methyloprofundus sp.]